MHRNLCADPASDFLVTLRPLLGVNRVLGILPLVISKTSRGCTVKWSLRADRYSKVVFLVTYLCAFGFTCYLASAKSSPSQLSSITTLDYG